ncbi:antibiotic biosynthesis monooxygenase family protein [Gynuella sp.]|uniref:antibiotic biosynthesis monooxygenase family protein n=1 Tax=Gynuella sp. TaxID=2969146 RepID=UPI003D0A703A
MNATTGTEILSNVQPYFVPQRSILCSDGYSTCILSSQQDHNVIAVLFEAQLLPDKQHRYLQLAEQLKPLLDNIDGFVSIERFQSTTNPDKIISLSWWRNERSIEQWKRNSLHKLSQEEGKRSIFCHYKINVLTSVREHCSQ